MVDTDIKECPKCGGSGTTWEDDAKAADRPRGMVCNRCQGNGVIIAASQQSPNHNETDEDR